MKKNKVQEKETINMITSETIELDGKKRKKPKNKLGFVATLTLIGVIVGILGGIITILAYFGIQPKQKPESTAQESSDELVNDGLPLPDDQTEPADGTTTESSAAATTAATTQANTDAGTTAATETTAASPSEGTASSGQTWKVEALFSVSDYSAYYNQELQYDPVNRSLYYHDSVNNKILRYDLDTGNSETVLEGETDEILVDQNAGKAYAFYRGRSSQTGWGELYDLSTGKQINIAVYGQGNNIVETAKLMYASNYDMEIRSIETGELISNGKRPRSTSIWRPFLHDDCYYYMSRDFGSSAFYIDKTVQLVTPDGSYEAVKEYKTTDNISAVHVAADAVYYITKDNAIYQVNLDSSTSSGNGGPIVVGDSSADSATKNDILIVDGADIQNTATSYLSSDIKELVKISDTAFAVYDKTDKTVKLVSKAS